MEGGEDGIADAVGRALAVGGLGGDVDVDAGPEQGVSADKTGAGTLSFAENVIRREAGEGNLGERFLLIIENAVVEVEELLRGGLKPGPSLNLVQSRGSPERRGITARRERQCLSTRPSLLCLRIRVHDSLA